MGIHVFEVRLFYRTHEHVHLEINAETVLVLLSLPQGAMEQVSSGKACFGIRHEPELVLQFKHTCLPTVGRNSATGS